MDGTPARFLAGPSLRDRGSSKQWRSGLTTDEGGPHGRALQAPEEHRMGQQGSTVENGGPGGGGPPLVPRNDTRRSHEKVPVSPSVPERARRSRSWEGSGKLLTVCGARRGRALIRGRETGPGNGWIVLGTNTFVCFVTHTVLPEKVLQSRLLQCCQVCQLVDL